MANPTSNERLTKAERKEQARLQRLELQRRMARTRRTRRIAIAVVLVVVAGSAAYALTRPEPERVDPQRLLAAAANGREQAGCGEVEDVGAYEPESSDATHTDALPPLSTYASTPPASGPHNDLTLGPGVYSDPPEIGRLLHSLEHGAAVVWYAPDASGPQLERIMDFYADGEVGDRVIVAPYDYPDQGEAGVLSGGMALVAWHRVQTCQRLSLAAAFGFTSSFAGPPFEDRPYRGEAPEAGLAF